MKYQDLCQFATTNKTGGSTYKNCSHKRNWVQFKDTVKENAYILAKQSKNKINNNKIKDHFPLIIKQIDEVEWPYYILREKIFQLGTSCIYKQNRIQKNWIH